MKVQLASVRARALSGVLAFFALAGVSSSVRADVKASIETALNSAVVGNEIQNVALGKQLAELGSWADSALFDALARELAASSVSTSPRPAVLLSAFESMGPLRWRPLLGTKLGTGGNLNAIGAIIAIAGRCGAPDEVSVVLSAAGFDHDGVYRAEVERTITSILVRHAAAFDAVDRAIASIQPDLRSAMVRAVEASRVPPAALLLARWIEAHREMRFECLPYLSRLSLSLQKPLPPEVLAPVRALVESGEESTLDEAILCGGRLLDYDSVPALIRHLKEGDYGARAGALWALRSITKLQFGKDPNEWAAWFEGETRWWNNESRQVLAQLVHGSKAQKVEALRQISLLRAWPDRAATEIAIALDDADEDIAVLTANELRRLDSRPAVPALVDALFGGRTRVADAARAALQSITKLELPSEPLAVRELLVPNR